MLKRDVPLNLKHLSDDESPHSLEGSVFSKTKCYLRYSHLNVFTVTVAKYPATSIKMEVLNDSAAKSLSVMSNAKSRTNCKILCAEDLHTKTNKIFQNTLEVVTRSKNKLLKKKKKKEKKKRRC